MDMHADAIISRDAAFKTQAHAQIPVFSSSEYFDWLESERGIAYADIPFA
ncbi:MAG: hypothetical protein IJ131_10910 [Eggerthellaceae bacterium]|nr:hypothetical protein [Eggerthellaceae bacterium]